jgi:5-oxoprolinase (ATP-hydrolysing) subunit A
VEIAARRRVITAAGAPLTVEADTVCIHSDTKGAAEIARAVRHGLIHSGIAVRAF